MKKLDLNEIEDYVNSFYGKLNEKENKPGIYAYMFDYRLTRRIIRTQLPIFIKAYDKYFRTLKNTVDIFDGSFDSLHREIFRDYLLAKVFNKDTIDLEYGRFLQEDMCIKGYKGFRIW